MMLLKRDDNLLMIIRMALNSSQVLISHILSGKKESSLSARIVGEKIQHTHIVSVFECLVCVSVASAGAAAAKQIKEVR
jgi:hypothetical protein